LLVPKFFQPSIFRMEIRDEFQRLAIALGLGLIVMHQPGRLDFGSRTPEASIANPF